MIKESASIKTNLEQECRTFKDAHGYRDVVAKRFDFSIFLSCRIWSNNPHHGCSVIIADLTVGLKSVEAAMSNPVKSLGSEKVTGQPSISFKEVALI